MSTMKIILRKKYNEFHEDSSLISKVISENNFTYINILEILRKTVSSKSISTVLDIGCGVGAIDFYLARKGYKVTGIDISNKAIKVAKQSAKELNILTVNFLSSSVEDLKLKDRFDLIICSEVLEHLQDDMKALLKMNILLKDNGGIIVSVPSVNAPLYKLGLAEKFDKRVGHLRRYSLNQIVSLIEKAGFKIEETYKTEGVIRNSLYLFKQLGFFIRLIKGPLVKIASSIDRMTIPLFGESQIFVVARKI